MKRFIRFVILGWNSPSNLDEPTPAPSILARWRQWRRRGEWPGGFGRMLRDGFNAGWEAAMEAAQKRAGADTAPPPTTE